MHKKEIVTAGKNIKEAKKALIMLHGRGAEASDILSLATHLNVKEYALVAPQATNYTWYPYSFMANPDHNEPWLSSALQLVGDIVKDLNAAGITSENIYFAGFSQGACLTLEFTARNAKKWGGIVAFTGGLIGDKLYTQNYTGNFAGTPVFIGTSNPDPHVPVERVQATTGVLKNMHAAVTEKVYQNMGHTVSQDEIDQANKLVFVN
ncbi:alpha/beta hydrolase [Ohtaekwangia koreensis]|uniref:Phospholipase/carboxylesterase n=1 Tax=Ohtaekwangia koreensis TaxID=688867 RepID=A0A1T5M7B7_9BACT|nr:dienelactone hydrolase family protein [Ohtaekwangia koreensis]SKC84035.1 phospholipase/carboxylesterase [Ohtaekwangia koreensis]